MNWRLDSLSHKIQMAGDQRFTGIDKRHGFMQQIIRNQIDRDEYDKEVKAAKEQQKQEHRCAQRTKPRRPERNVYVPPKAGDVSKTADTQDTSENPPTEEKDNLVELFELEYVDEKEEIYHYMIYKNDVPSKVAQMLGRKHGLKHLLVKVLADRIQEEMQLRQAGT